MVRLLLVDDQRFIRESLKAIFENEPNIQVVGTASDGATAIEQVEYLNPDVVLLDLEMPQLSGLEATRLIRQNFETVKILVFSSHEEQECIDYALELGASGYLLKSSSHCEIKQAVHIVSQGHKLPNPLMKIKERILEPQSLQIIKAETVIPTFSINKQPLSEHPKTEAISSERSLQIQLRQTTAIANTNSSTPNSSIIESKLLVSPQTSWKQYLGFGLTFAALLAVISTVIYRQGIVPSQSIAVSSVEKPLPVESLELSPVSSMEVSRDYVGEIAPKRKSSLSFEKVGRVTRILAKAGDRVTAGQPLAYLDAQSIDLQRQDLIAQRDQAVARLAELKAGPIQENIASAQAVIKPIQEQLNLAIVKRDRRNQLFQAGAISQEQLNDATTEVQRLQAMIEEAESRVKELQAGTRPESISAQQAAIASIEAKIDSLQLEQRNSVLKAPFAGQIADRLIDEGTVISPGQPVMQLIEGGDVEAIVGVPSSVALTLQRGNNYSIQVNEAKHSATFRDVLPELDPNTLTQKAIFSVASSQAKQLPSNQIVRLSLRESVKTSGFWVPIVALTKGNRGLWSSFVLERHPLSNQQEPTETYKLTKQDVEILHTESDRALVRGTLKSGDKIVASGVHRLVPGQLVIISKQQTTQ
jgi:RND family efflux transporter MFP subunit